MIRHSIEHTCERECLCAYEYLLYPELNCQFFVFPLGLSEEKGGINPARRGGPSYSRVKNFFAEAGGGSR